MEKRSHIFYPSARLEKDDLEQGLETKLNDVNSFNNSANNIKEIITHFKDKESKSKRESVKYKTLTAVLKSCNLFVIIATTTSSITLTFLEIGFIVTTISTATACLLSNGIKIVYETIFKKL